MQNWGLEVKSHLRNFCFRLELRINIQYGMYRENAILNVGQEFLFYLLETFVFSGHVHGGQARLSFV